MQHPEAVKMSIGSIKKYLKGNNRGIAGACMLVLAVGAGAQQAPVTRGGTSIDDRLSRVERLLEGQALFDLVNQIDTLQRELQRMRGELEQHSYELEQLRNRQRDLFVDIDRRLQKLEGGRTGLSPATMAPTVPMVLSDSGDNPPLEVLTPATEPIEPDGAEQAPPLSVETQASVDQAAAPAPLSTPSAESQAAAAPGAVPGSVATLPAGAVAVDPALAEASYREAFGLLKAGRYDESIAAFNAYLVEFPTSTYADNAQYWLGEAYYVMRQFEAAIGEYQKLIQSYPQSAKLTHAQLKMGYSLHEIGKTAEAKLQLESLVSSYPGTTTARLAEKRLQQIRMEEGP